MNLSNVPFYLTLISGILPLFAAFFDSELFTYVPFVLTVTAFLLYLVANKFVIKRVSLGVLFLLLFILAHFLYTSLTVGYGSFGLLVLVLTTFIYVQLFNFAEAYLKPDKLISQLIIIYLSHLIYMFLEFFLRVFGYQNLLLSLFGSAQNVTKLKDYNSATFLHSVFGLPENFFGLGGLLLGSQSAGQVAASTFIISGLWYKYSPLKGLKHWVFNALAFLMFCCAINMTMLLILTTIFLLMIFVIDFSRLKKIKIQIFVLLGVIIFDETITSILTYRLKNFDLDMDIYLDAFSAPIKTFFDFTLNELFFGLGRYEVRAHSADFGLGMIISQVGFFFVMILGFAISSIIFLTFCETKIVVGLGKVCSTERKKWAWLATVNALISFIFAIGLFHYTPSIELGGLQMFAFSIALTIISIRYLRKFRYNDIK